MLQFIIIYNEQMFEDFFFLHQIFWYIRSVVDAFNTNIKCSQIINSIHWYLLSIFSMESFVFRFVIHPRIMYSVSYHVYCRALCHYHNQFHINARYGVISDNIRFYYATKSLHPVLFVLHANTIQNARIVSQPNS